MNLLQQLDYQSHLLDDQEDYAMGDKGNFFGYGELNTNKISVNLGQLLNIKF